MKRGSYFLLLLALSLFVFPVSVAAQSCDEVVPLIQKNNKKRYSCCLSDDSGSQVNSLVRVEDEFSSTVTKFLGFSKRKAFRRKFSTTGKSFWNTLRKQATRCKKISDDRYIIDDDDTDVDACDVAGNLSASSVNTRIINGDQCTIGNSSTVFLLFSYGSACTGNYISDDAGNPAVLTAAHCLKGDWENGTTTVTVTSGNDEVTSTSAFFMTEYSSSNTNPGANDVAVILLPSQLSETNTATIHTTNDFVDGETATIAGYGRIGTGSASDNNNAANLYAGTMEIDNNDSSNGSSDLRDTNEEEIMANFSHPDGSNTCNGDSGGPLFVLRNESWVLAGVTSYGFSTNCGPTDSSGFANLTDPNNLNFICTHVPELSFCS